MKRCTQCIMPSTKVGITFDERGVCNACQYAEKRARETQKEKDARYELLVKLANQAVEHADGEYNCAIAVSGGKDSLFLTFKAKELGLNPLGIYVQPLKPTARGELNIANLNRFIRIYRVMVNQDGMSDKLRRSFIEKGLPLQPYDDLLYSIPVVIAEKQKIPLIIWGENSEAEYGNAPEPAQQYQGYRLRHTTQIYMSDFIKWDSVANGEFAVEHGLTPRPDSELLGTGGFWNYEQLDDEFPIVSHYMKYIKMGYGRATDQACREIRLGYIIRDAALGLAKMYDGHINPSYVANYCNYIGMELPEFFEVVEKWRGKSHLES